MTTNRLESLLAEKPVLLADGATGTNLFAMGLESGEAPELWNDDAPEKIVALHQGFVDAGADIILTNSFGGTRHRLKLHHAQDRVFELNRKAAELARSVADKSDRTVIVAGSVGPTGELLQPLGALTYDDAVAAFVEQIEGLKAGGADVAWIETMSAPEEARAAAEAAVRVGSALHLHLLFRYRRSVHDGPGTEGHPRCGRWSDPEADCGRRQLRRRRVGHSGVASGHDEARPDAAVIVKGNCGIPEFRGTEIHYSGTPDLMADYARLAIDAGARIIGGCCGTSFEHLRAMRNAIDHHQTADRPTVQTISDRIGPLPQQDRRPEWCGRRPGRRERRRARA